GPGVTRRASPLPLSTRLGVALPGLPPRLAMRAASRPHAAERLLLAQIGERQRGIGQVRGTGESACKRNQIASNHSFDVERNGDKDADVSDKILTLTC